MLKFERGEKMKAYTFCDVLGNPLSNYEEGMWAQVRQYGKLLMIHI